MGLKELTAAVIETRLARRARRACSSRRNGGSAPSPRRAPRSGRSCSRARCAPRGECPGAHRSSCSARVLRASCETWTRPRRRPAGVMRPRRGRVLEALRGRKARDAFQHREPFAGPVMLDGENSRVGQAAGGRFRNPLRLQGVQQRNKVHGPEDAAARIRWGWGARPWRPAENSRLRKLAVSAMSCKWTCLMAPLGN